MSVLSGVVLLAGEVIHDLDEKFFAFVETPINRFELLTLFIEDQRDNPMSGSQNFVVLVESVLKVLNLLFKRGNSCFQRHKYYLFLLVGL